MIDAKAWISASANIVLIVKGSVGVVALTVHSPFVVCAPDAWGCSKNGFEVNHKSIYRWWRRWWDQWTHSSSKKASVCGCVCYCPCTPIDCQRQEWTWKWLRHASHRYSLLDRSRGMNTRSYWWMMRVCVDRPSGCVTMQMGNWQDEVTKNRSGVVFKRTNALRYTATLSVTSRLLMQSNDTWCCQAAHEPHQHNNNTKPHEQHNYGIITTNNRGTQDDSIYTHTHTHMPSHTITTG